MLLLRYNNSQGTLFGIYELKNTQLLTIRQDIFVILFDYYADGILSTVLA